MPTVFRIHSIKIDLYSRDHLPPHFHALYNEYEALIVIEDGAVYAGWLPARKLLAVRRWLMEPAVREMLLTIFKRLNPGLRE